MQTNISIRVVGFGWKQFHISWSHKRTKRPLYKLADWLRGIIRKEKDMEIPVKPHVEINPRTETPVRGTMTDERRQLNPKHFKTQGKMVKLLDTVAGVSKQENVWKAHITWYQQSQIHIVSEFVLVLYVHSIEPHR